MSETTRRARTAWLRRAMSEHESDLLRYTRRLLDDEQKAREVVQETWLKLWKADRDKIDGHLRQWLFTVCRNRALDVRRREDRMRPMDVDEAERRPSVAPTPSEQVERRESLGRARRAIDALPDNQREVIRLKFQQGLSYKEISSITGHSVSNVGYLIHVGMKALRASLLEDTSASTPSSRRTS